MQTERISYPLDEGLEKIGLSHTAGYKAINRGELRTFKAGRRRMVTHKALLEYVAHLEQQSNACGCAA